MLHTTCIIAQMIVQLRTLQNTQYGIRQIWQYSRSFLNPPRINGIYNPDTQCTQSSAWSIYYKWLVDQL